MLDVEAQELCGFQVKEALRHRQAYWLLILHCQVALIDPGLCCLPANVSRAQIASLELKFRYRGCIWKRAFLCRHISGLHRALLQPPRVARPNQKKNGLEMVGSNKILAKTFKACLKIRKLASKSKCLRPKTFFPGQGQCTGNFLPANSGSFVACVGLRSIQISFVTGRDKSKTWRATRKGWKHMGSLKQFISCLNILQEADLKPVSSLQAACAAMR